MAQVCDCKHEKLSVRTRTNEIYNILRSGNEAKSGFEFHDSIHNASKIPRNVENGSVFMGTECLNNRFPSAYSVMCDIDREARKSEKKITQIYC